MRKPLSLFLQFFTLYSTAKSMKNFILIFTLFCGGFVSYGQNNQSYRTKTEPIQQQRHIDSTATSNGLGDTANLQKDVSVSGVFKYTFQSDKIIEPSKVERWTSRFEQRFSQIINIQLISSSQLVIITLNDTHSEGELLDIVQRFGFLDYSIIE